jgi:hypothetical protein
MILPGRAGLPAGAGLASLYGGSDPDRRWRLDLRALVARGDVFAYFVSDAKARDPIAAQASIKKLARGNASACSGTDRCRFRPARAP